MILINRGTILLFCTKLIQPLASSNLTVTLMSQPRPELLPTPSPLLALVAGSLYALYDNNFYLRIKDQLFQQLSFKFN